MINAVSRTMAATLASLKRMESQVQDTLGRIEKPPSTREAKESLRLAQKAQASLNEALSETSQNLVSTSFDIRA